MELLKPAALGVVLGLAGGLAQAHVMVQPTTAAAGAYQVLRFGAGHGCEDKLATTAISVAIPDQVTVARPQPKPGWRLDITRRADGHVTAVAWTGALPPDEYDEFLVLVKLPPADGELALPVTQTCGDTVVRWSETGAEVKSHPAPKLILSGAMDMHAGHAGH